MLLRRFVRSLLVAIALICWPQSESVSMPEPRWVAPRPAQHGEASYYADAFHGRTTASGEPFDMHELTAAHRKLAFGTQVRVTNLDNGRAVVVRINDRGPYYGERVIDLSYGAASELMMVDAGVVPVDIEILPPQPALATLSASDVVTVAALRATTAAVR
jgi:rare lipoprotein A